MQQPEAHRFPVSGGIPNNRLPLLLYRRAVTLDADDPASTFETRFAMEGLDDGIGAV